MRKTLALLTLLIFLASVSLGVVMVKLPESSQPTPVAEGFKLLCKPLNLTPEHKTFWQEIWGWIHEYFSGYSLSFWKLQTGTKISFIPTIPEVEASPASSPIATLESKSYFYPITNGYCLYSALLSLNIVWDGVNAIDRYSTLTLIWHLQKAGVTVSPSTMTLTALQESGACSVTRRGTLSDGSSFTIQYFLPDNGSLKYNISYTPTEKPPPSYRLWFEVQGLLDENANSYLTPIKVNSKKVQLNLPPYVGGSLWFDYNDVTLYTTSEEFDSTNFKYNFYIDLGKLIAGKTYTVDPTTVGTTAGQYATSLGNNCKLFRDAYGKYIALWKNSNVMLGYANNDPPTTWTQNDLGSSFAPAAGQSTGVAGAYNPFLPLSLAQPMPSDLTSGTIDGNTLTTDSGGAWYEIVLSSYTLTANRRYAIVVRATSGDTNNRAYWKYASGNPYVNGAELDSTDSGGTWINQADDFSFEVYDGTTLYEAQNTTSPNSIAVWGTAWEAQSFTVGALDHAVTSVKLKLYRVGNPSTVTVSIREVPVEALLTVWVTGKTIKLAQIAFTRNGSNNITGYSAGSVLTIDLTTATGGNSAIDAAYNPSAWMLHNGEVQVVAGGNSTAGAKTGRTYGWRVVFGSPPTFKNAAGTASTIDALGTEYTTNHATHYQAVVQRTNAGTGQYDIYVLFNYIYDTTSSYNRRQIATWASPNWSWGSDSQSGSSGIHKTVNYDSINGLIVYSSVNNLAGGTTVGCSTYDASDSITDISVTGLPSATRASASLAINGGDYYVFYHIGASPNGTIYYIKRTGGSWGDETSFASAAECYPSTKVGGAGNRIELIWTHYTGSAYNVYYDSISLAGQYSKTLTDSSSQSDILSRLGKYTRTPSESESLSDQLLKSVGLSKTLQDSQSVNEQLSRIFGRPVSLDEQQSLSELLSRRFIGLRGLSESLTASESISKSLLKTLTESQVISETISRLGVFGRGITDSLSQSESLSRLFGAIRSFTDIFDLSEILQAQYTPSGQNYPRSIVDSLAMSELLSTSAGFPRILSESSAFSEIFRLGVAKQIQESFALNESLSRTLIAVRSPIDSATLTELLSRAFIGSRAIQEAFTSSETLSRNLVLARTFSDITVLGEIFKIGLGKTLSETIAVSESLVRSLIAQRVRIDSSTISESLSRLGVLARPLTDSQAFSEALARAFTGARAFTELSTINELLLKGVGKYFTDSMTISESLSRTLVLGRTLSDYFTMFESVSTGQVFPREIADALTMVESLARRFSGTRTITEPSTLTELLKLGIGKPLTESLTQSETLSRILILQRPIADTLTASETLARTLILARGFTDASSLTETLTRTLTLGRTATETLISSEFLRLGFGKPLTESFTASESLSRTLSARRINIETLTLTESILRAFSGTRSLTDSSLISETLSRNLILQRGIIDISTINELLSRSFIGSRPLTESQSISELLSRTLILQRLITETSAINESISRLAAIGKTLTDSQSLSESLTRMLLAQRTLTDITAFFESIAIGGVNIRTITETMSLSETLSRQFKGVRTVTSIQAFIDLIEAQIPQHIQRNLYETLTLIESLIGLKTTPTPQIGEVSPRLIRIGLFEALIGAFQIKPYWGLPLPQTLTTIDISIFNKFNTPQDITVKIWVTDSKGEQVYTYQETFKQTPVGATTRTIAIPMRKTGDYTAHMTIIYDSESSAEALQYFTVTPLDLWFSTIIIAVAIAIIIIVILILYWKGYIFSVHAEK